MLLLRGSAIPMYFHFQCSTDILALNSTQYQFGRLRMMLTLIQFFGVLQKLHQVILL